MDQDWLKQILQLMSTTPRLGISPAFMAWTQKQNWKLSGLMEMFKCLA